MQGGTAFGAGRDYFILGIGGGYYVVDGLRLGLQGAVWMFDSPFIFTVTPEVTYVMHFVPAVKPYIGAFYRGYIVGDNFEDTSTLGTRFGVNVPIAMGRGYFGVGGVYEHFLSCGEFRPCDTVYPEVAVAFAF